MQQVLIDTFIVPETSKHVFLENARRVQGFLKMLPGFMEGYLYEKSDGESDCNYVTTAVWESEEALEMATQALAAEFKRQNFDPRALRASLKIEGQRALYSRLPY